MLVLHGNDVGDESQLSCLKAAWPDTQATQHHGICWHLPRYSTSSGVSSQVRHACYLSKHSQRTVRGTPHLTWSPETGPRRWCLQGSDPCIVSHLQSHPHPPRTPPPHTNHTPHHCHVNWCQLAFHAHNRPPVKVPTRQRSRTL